MKASRAVCSRRTGVSAGGGGRTVVGRRVVGGKRPAAEIFSGGFPVGPKKRGYRITKERDANTGERMDVSSSKERGRGQGGNPQRFMKPNNAVDRRVCAYMFREGPKPQRFRVFKSVKGTVGRSKRIQRSWPKELPQSVENRVFGPANVFKGLENLRGGIVPELMVGVNCSFQGVLGELGSQVEKGTRRDPHILIEEVSEMLDSRKNIRKELGMEFLKNLIVRTNEVNFVVGCSEKKET